MTGSFFLVQLIDKNNYKGIAKLHRMVQDTFLLGRSTIKNGSIYIKGIEPSPENSTDLSEISFAQDSSSIWLSMGIIPQPTFEENIVIFKELDKWVMDSLYILRFVMNLNLKAKMFYHVEINQVGQEDQKITIQENFDPGCDSGSIFNVNFNRYDLVFPLLNRLLKFRPTNKFKSIMYNHATAQIGSSAIIDYFYSFASFEGILHNWAEENGYSELWGAAIATPEEQSSLHEDLYHHFRQFLSQNQFEVLKQDQLRSFLDSTFPRDRRIRRTLKQRFSSYLDKRLAPEIREKDAIQKMWSQFRNIYSRRNEIGHSLETYTRSPGLIEDSETLYSSLKIMMDFELDKFIQGESDWKFEERATNLEEFISPMTPRKVLNHFLLVLDGENQINVRVRSNTGVESLEKVKFHSEMACGEGENLSKIYYDKKLKIKYLPNFRPRRQVQQNNQRVISINPNPYYWIYVNVGNANYVFKTFEPSLITSTLGGSTRSKFSADHILMVLKAESIDIPDNSLMFSEELDF